MGARAPRLERGMTLIELLIVVAIIGLVAAIAAVNLVSAIERGRQRRTMADMHTLALAVHAYHNDFSLFPIADGEISAIRRNLEPTYLQVLPSQDGWNEPLLYHSDGTRYTVLSLGGDRTATPPYSLRPTTNIADDIVFRDGAFVQWPEGMQQSGGGGP